MQDDLISRQAVIDAVCRFGCGNERNGKLMITMAEAKQSIVDLLEDLPSVQPEPKTGHCKDCKWWKDSDGAYRRGLYAESQCPINRRKVFEGNGYCYMFAPQESEK